MLALNVFLVIFLQVHRKKLNSIQGKSTTDFSFEMINIIDTFSRYFLVLLSLLRTFWVNFHCLNSLYFEPSIFWNFLWNVENFSTQYTSFIIQYLKPKHLITRIFHVFLHENSVKVISSLYTFFDVITFCKNFVKLISRK